MPSQSCTILHHHHHHPEHQLHQHQIAKPPIALVEELYTLPPSKITSTICKPSPLQTPHSSSPAQEEPSPSQTHTHLLQHHRPSYQHNLHLQSLLKSVPPHTPHNLLQHVPPQTPAQSFFMSCTITVTCTIMQLSSMLTTIAQSPTIIYNSNTITYTSTIISTAVPSQTPEQSSTAVPSQTPAQSKIPLAHSSSPV